MNNELNAQTVFMAGPDGKIMLDENGAAIPAEINLKPFVGE